KKDIIRVGSNTRAIVSLVYDQEKIEAVYLQNSTGKHIAESFILIDGRWQFESPSPSGVYAEKSDRLIEYIKLLESSYNQ
ncbi:MAG: hypothetical protein RIF46_03735, partial [Cyclobacteriaceae bacterium]